MPKGQTVTNLRAYVESRIEVVDGHWLWTGCRSPDGYGLCRVQGFYLAHRLAWSAFVGPIPDDQTIDHECLTPACIRPGDGHLRLLTLAENSADAMARRVDPDRCLNGHPVSEFGFRTAAGKRQCRRCRADREAARRRRAIKENTA